MNPTFLSKYTIVDKIGEGSFSEVLKCEDKLNGRAYAAKRLKKIFKSPFDVANCAEIIAMNKLSRHPNIVYMVEFHYDPSQGRVIFVFELMDMSMYEFLKTKKRRIAEPKVQCYLYQILKGLNHLHSQGLFHRDIKPENILIKLAHPYPDTPYILPGEIVKIADLGSIRGIYSKPPYTEYISTRWYRSPECLLTVGHYGPKMDIWAAGCVFYEMLTLKPLFPGQDEIDQLSKIHEVLGTPLERTLNKFKRKSRNFARFPKLVGVGLKSLVNRIGEDALTILQLMLQYDPDTRANVRRLLEHRLFKPFKDLETNYKFKTEVHTQKEYTTGIYNSNGDFNLSDLQCDILLTSNKNKYKTSSSRTSSSTSSKKTKPRKPYDRPTDSNLLNLKPTTKKEICKLVSPVPLVNNKEMRAWGVNPNILKSRADAQIGVPNSILKIKPLLNKPFKRVVSTSQQFSKTTSCLPDSTNYDNVELSKSNQLQSKSCVPSPSK